MQVKKLLCKLKSRDKARGLERPVLEDLYLHDCELEDHHFRTWEGLYRPVVFHQSIPSHESHSTWVGPPKTPSMV